MTVGTYNQPGNFRVFTALIVWTCLSYQLVLTSKTGMNIAPKTHEISGEVLFASATASEPDCSRYNGLGKEECLEKIDAGCPLTFVGPGCGSGDGGCQPEGWCGFTCRRRCKNFDRCFWKHGFGCKQRATASPTPEPPTPAPTPQPPTAAPSLSCEPVPGMDRATCDSKIDAGCGLTWVGPGCPEGGDGGCQPSGWCGFKCRDRCNDFDRCKWVAGVGCQSIFSHVFTFTSGTQTGRLGPSLENLLANYDTEEYPWLEDPASFNATDGIQSWTVPQNGTYKITAYGAQGGGPDSLGGKGAQLSGAFDLTAGTRLSILVGQKGLTGANGLSAGGGGVSAVWIEDPTLVPMVIAAAGGGVTTAQDGSGSTPEGSHGQISENAMSGQSSPNWNNFDGGTNGNGGGSSNGNGGAGSGGGYLTDAGGDTGGAQGLGRPNGWLGGEQRTSGNDPVEGSFGGGGGASHNGGDYRGGGGGGGYSGGGAGVGDGSGSAGAGGGGGSFNSGANQDNQSGMNEGDGMVIVEAL